MFFVLICSADFFTATNELVGGCSSRCAVGVLKDSTKVFSWGKSSKEWTGGSVRSGNSGYHNQVLHLPHRHPLVILPAHTNNNT